MNPAHLRISIGPDRQPSIELIDSPDALDVPARCESCGDPGADGSGLCCYCQESMNNEYQITTIQDILNLPTEEHIKRCVADLADSLIFVRQSYDFARGSLKEGLTYPFPEGFLWIDDGEGQNSTVSFADESGKEALTITKKHTPPEIHP